MDILKVETKEQVLARIELSNYTLIKAFAKHGKFYRDYMIVKQEIENLVNGETVNYLNLVKILCESISYHKSGKIEGIQSIDSTAHCSFCASMRKLAEKKKDIICGYCYDYEQETSYRAANVLPRHWLEMIILSVFDLPIELLKLLPIYTTYFRFNSSGDIENKQHMENIIKIVECFPHINFALWSKNQFVVDSVLDETGKPLNMKYIQSCYAINGKYIRSRYADAVFVVYTSDKIGKAIKNGAMECNGRKCMECGFNCYKSVVDGGFGNGVEIAEILRIQNGGKKEK